MHSLMNLLIWCFLLAVAVGAGYVVSRLLGLPTSPKLDTLLFSLAMGLGLFIYGTAVLGFLGLLQRPFVIGWVALVTVFALGGHWWLWRGPLPFDATPERASISPVYPLWGVKLALVAFLVLYLLIALTPPMDGDSLHSYLDIPRQYMDAARIIPLPYELNSTLPMNVQMLSALVLAVAGDEVAQMLVGAAMAGASVLVIFALGRRYQSREVGLVAGLLFISMREVVYIAPTAKVNLGYAFFDLLAVYAMGQWAYDADHSDRWLIVGGVLSGLALGTHYYAGFTAIVLAACIALVSRKDGIRHTMMSLLRYGLPMVLLGSPWLVKNYLFVGNPVAPVLNPLFGLPPLDDITKQAWSISGLVTVLWDMSTGKIARFGQPVGPTILLVLPGLLLLRRVDHKVKVAIGFATVLYLLWYTGYQVPRNFLTGLGILSLVAAYAYVELGRRSHLLRYGFMILVASLLLFNWADSAHQFLVTRKCHLYVLGLESRDEFVRRLLDMHTLYPSGAMTDYMNERLPYDARILAVNNSNGYYVHRAYIDSHLLDGDFSHDTIGDERRFPPSTFLDQCRAAGITHIFISEPWWRALEEGDNTGQGLVMSVLADSQFRAQCLEEVFSDRNQHLFALLCR